MLVKFLTGVTAACRVFEVFGKGLKNEEPHFLFFDKSILSPEGTPLDALFSKVDVFSIIL